MQLFNVKVEGSLETTVQGSKSECGPLALFWPPVVD